MAISASSNRSLYLYHAHLRQSQGFPLPPDLVSKSCPLSPNSKIYKQKRSEIRIRLWFKVKFRIRIWFVVMLASELTVRAHGECPRDRDVGRSAWDSGTPRSSCSRLRRVVAGRGSSCGCSPERPAVAGTSSGTASPAAPSTSFSSHDYNKNCLIFSSLIVDKYWTLFIELHIMVINLERSINSPQELIHKHAREYAHEYAAD